jgi:hypothetical protein
MITLTDKEAEELMIRLEQLVNSREFLEKSYFVESLTQKLKEKERMLERYISQPVYALESRECLPHVNGLSSKRGLA